MQLKLGYFCFDNDNSSCTYSRRDVSPYILLHIKMTSNVTLVRSST